MFTLSDFLNKIINDFFAFSTKATTAIETVNRDSTNTFNFYYSNEQGIY